MTPGLEGVVFQCDLRLFEHAQDIGQVFAVEGDLGFVALGSGIDFTDVIADFFGAGGNGQFAGVSSPPDA